MSTRRAAAALTLLLCLTGCAGNTEPDAATAESSGEASTSAAPSVSPSPPAVSPSSASAAEPSDNKPTAGAAKTITITGTVEAGVEPNCRLLKDATGAHLLVLRDASLRDQAAVGMRITATGRSEPTMMSTCQQGIPFIVTAIGPA